MKKQHLADSVLNRILNFAADLDATTPIAPQSALAGPALDAKLAEPVAAIDPAADPALASQLVDQGLGLPPAPR